MPSTSTQGAIVVSWLQHLRALHFLVEADAEIIASMEARLDLTGVNYEGVGGGAGSDMGDKVAELVDMKRKLTARHVATWLEYEQGREVCLNGELERALLWEHYVEGLTWHEVGQRHDLHGKYVPAKAKAGIPGIYADMPKDYASIPEAL